MNLFISSASTIAIVWTHYGEPKVGDIGTLFITVSVFEMALSPFGQLNKITPFGWCLNIRRCSLSEIFDSGGGFKRACFAIISDRSCFYRSLPHNSKDIALLRQEWATDSWKLAFFRFLGFLHLPGAALLLAKPIFFCLMVIMAVYLYLSKFLMKKMNKISSADVI